MYEILIPKDAVLEGVPKGAYCGLDVRRLLHSLWFDRAPMNDHGVGVAILALWLPWGSLPPRKMP